MKKVLLGLLLLMLALIPVALIAPGYLAWNEYKPRIVDMVDQHTGLNIEIAGDIKLALLPYPYAYVSDVTVRNPEDFSGEPFLRLKRLDIALQFAPLLSGEVALSSVDLVSPEITVTQNSDDTWNWQTEKIIALMNAGAKENTEPEPEQTERRLALSFDRVEINNGTLIYALKGAEPQTIDDVDVVLSAESLDGPFQANGDIGFQNRKIAIDINTGRLDESSKSLPVNAEVKDAGATAQLEYSGVLSLGEPFELQGQTRIEVQDIASMVQSVSGQAANTPFRRLQMSGLLTVNQSGAAYKDMAMTLDEQSFDGSLEVQENFTVVKLDIQSNRLTALPGISKAALDGLFSMSGDMFEGRSIVLELDDARISGNVSYAPQGDRGLLKANVNAGGLDITPFLPQSSNKVTSKSITANALKDMVRSIVLPFDAELMFQSPAITYNDMRFADVDVAGSLRDNILSISKLNISGFKGSTIKLQGEIQNLPELTGMDVKFGLDTNDVRPLAEFLNVDVSGLPAGLKTAKLNAQYAGTINAGDVTLNANAFGGDIIAKGKVDEPLGTYALSSTTVQVKHPNFENFIQSVTGSASGFTSFAKPLDFYADVNSAQGGDGVTLDIKSTLGNMSMTGNTTLTNLSQKPSITGDLQFGRLVLTTAVNNTSRANAGWSSEPINKDIFYMMDMDLNLSAEALQYNAWDLNAPKARLILRDGRAEIKDLTSGLYDGTIFMTAITQGPRQGPVSMDTELKVRDVSLEPLVRSFTGGRILKGQGLIDIDANVKSAGLSQAALVSALTGNGLMSGKNIVIDGFNLERFARAMSEETKVGDTVLGLWKTTTKGGQTRFDVMDGSFDIANGVLNISKMDLDGPQALVSTTGTIDLQKWILDSAFEIDLKQPEEEEQTPPFTIKVAGPLDNPAQTLGQGVLNDYLSRKVNRKLNDVIQDQLGGKIGEKLFGRRAPEQAPANDVGDEQPANATSSGQEQSAPQPAKQEQQKEIDPAEEAVKGLIRGLLQQ